MARKTKRVTITAEGRDKGKTFLITELPADQAERWAIRALLALIQSGAVISEDALHAGMASLASIGISALGGLTWEAAQPLLDEMFACVQYEHKAGLGAQDIMEGVSSQIEEVATRLSLRLDVFELHLGFSLPEEPPTSGINTEGANAEGKPSNTPTFLGSVVGWYRRALRRS